MPREALLSFDTDRIKEYVFATGNLRDIRGASALLDELNRIEMSVQVKEAAPEAKVIYAHGGSGMFVVSAENVEKARSAVEKLYREATVSATVTGVFAELPENTTSDVEITCVRNILKQRLRAAKERNPEYSVMITSPLFKLCESCGTFYATESFQGPEGEEKICRSCLLKKEKDKEIKNNIIQWINRLPNLKAERNDPLWKRLIASLAEEGYPFSREMNRPESLEELGELSKPRGYLALLVADGDNMGSRMDSLKNMNEIKEFARIVDQAVYNALLKAINKYLRPIEEDNYLPFDILLLGGDDLVLVTRAQSALDAAICLVEEFSSLTGNFFNPPLTLSASVVIAHSHYPFSALLRLADSGLKFAKKKAAQLRKNGEILKTGLINFLATSSTSCVNYEDYHYHNLVLEPPESPFFISRTLRPYEPEVLKYLLKIIRQLSGAPRTRLHQLYEACFLDLNNATLMGLMTLVRWQKQDAGESEKILRLFSELGSRYRCRENRFPWLITDSGRYFTPLVDLVELYDFIGGEEKDGTGL